MLAQLAMCRPVTLVMHRCPLAAMVSTAAKMAFASALCCVAAAASPRSAAFYELAPGTMPTSISADGSVIAGAIGDASFVWRMNDKKTTILNHNATVTAGNPSVAADGRTVAGSVLNGSLHGETAGGVWSFDANGTVSSFSFLS